MTLLSVEDTSKKYISKNSLTTHALQNINLQIEESEFIVLSGPSGSGKTTLLNILSGLDSPTKGRVFLEDDELTAMSEKQLTIIRLNKIGFIFQSYNLIPVLTARENIEYVLLLKKENKSIIKQRVEDISFQLGIKDLLDKKPFNMSGGQQQRVAVARALVSSPSIVFADEPTANLDSVTGKSLVDMMQKMNNDSGTTFVISSHDPMVIEQAGRNIILKDGCVISDKSH